ncbi:MAG: hypothetical protein KJ579_07315 [Verrucomicrobia bacterium]|nr:hypothetical protein [Verrucomicrobiota bacterium]
MTAIQGEMDLFSAHKPREQKVHANSIAAYHEMSTELSGRALTVLRIYRDAPAPMTDRQVLAALDPTKQDMNFVRPIITRLVDANAIVDVGSTKCKATNRTVRVCQFNRG